MKLYFKKDAESDLGEGIAYIEVTDGWPTRQVEVYTAEWRGADSHHLEWLADQHLDYLDLEEEDRIDAVEFENIWQQALSRCPQFS